MASERGLQNVLFPNLDLVIPYTKINFGEVFCSPQLVDPHNWVLVLYGLLVKSSVINTHSQGVVLLLDQYY
jgi:hypothetical protein